MKKQKEIFKSCEGDEWFDRNRNEFDLFKGKQIANFLKEIELFPKRYLEIGCGNGIRLNVIKEMFNAECFGIDPSKMAIDDGKDQYPDMSLQIGTADDLPYENNYFDSIAFGFCLYLCDRSDLFKIAYEADRCLKENGTLVIMDFSPPFPYKNKYAHLDGIYSYKMNYVQMFNWNPAYTEVANVIFSHHGYKLRDLPDERVGISVLRKNESIAYPEEPYK